MPLLDHFHPPLSQRRPRETIHTLWIAAMTMRLNGHVLPPRYIAEAQAHVGQQVEIDVATFEDEQDIPEHTSRNGHGIGLVTEVWAPPAPPLILSAAFADTFEIRILDQETPGRRLVAAIALVSPGNKDRPETRTAFVSKCAAYLQQGIGLVVIDIVSHRTANLHNELMTLLRQAEVAHWFTDGDLYTSCFRPRHDATGNSIACWPQRLTLGDALPIVPLPLLGGPTLPLDLELTYHETLVGSRLT